MKTSNYAQHGFTLLEVLVAVIILGLAYVAILQNFSASAQNMTRVEKSRESTFAGVIAFEQQVRSTAEPPELRSNNEIFLAGSTYRLVFFSDENHVFETLRLEKQ